MILDNQLNYNIQPDTSFNKIFLDVLVCCLKTGTLWNHHSRPLLEEYLQINLTLFSRPILIQQGLIQGQFISPGIYSYSWVQFMVSLFLQVYIYSYRRVQFKVSSFLQVYIHKAGFNSRIVHFSRYILIQLGSIQGQSISPGIYILIQKDSIQGQFISSGIYS